MAGIQLFVLVQYMCAQDNEPITGSHKYVQCSEPVFLNLFLNLNLFTMLMQITFITSSLQAIVIPHDILTYWRLCSLYSLGWVCPFVGI